MNNVQRNCIGRKGNKELCIANSRSVAGHAQKIREKTLVVSRSGLEKKRNGTDQTRTRHMDNRMMSLSTCCSTSAKADIPAFRGTSALERGALKSKGGGNLSIRFCGDSQTVEVGFSNCYFLQFRSVFTEQ